MSEVLELSPRINHGAVQPAGPYLAFSNPGSLEIELVKLMGVSVKESNDPIGFFGTGLKYAMATAFRLGGSMTIITGGKRYEVGGQKITLRNKEFTQITLDGEPLGFTTELGKQWEAWMVVRELYSNALDEGGRTDLVEGSLSADAGRTIIVLRGHCFTDVWKDRDSYFLDLGKEQPIQRSAFVDVYGCNQPGRSVFYRGIKIHETTAPTLYRYNLIDNVVLTEDRTLKYEFQLREALERTLITCTDKKILHRSLTTKNTFESDLPFNSSHSGVEMSEEFMACCAYLAERLPEGANRAAVRFYQNRTQTKQSLTPAILSSVQQMQLDKAIAFVEGIGCWNLTAFPIHVVRWLGEGHYGRAVDGLIYLSVECFDKGTKFVASTLYEEYVHCHYGFSDESRALQTFLFDRIISMGEDHVTKEPL